MLKRTLLLTLTICAVASLAISQPAYAQISEFKLLASDRAAGDEFGFSGNKRLYGLFRIVSKTHEGVTYEKKQSRRGFETRLGGYKTGL